MDLLEEVKKRLTEHYHVRAIFTAPSDRNRSKQVKTSTTFENVHTDPIKAVAMVHKALKGKSWNASEIHSLTAVKSSKKLKEDVGDVTHIMHASYTLGGKKQESTHYSSAKTVKDAHQEVGQHLYDKGARNIMTTHKSTRLGIGAVSHPKPAPKLIHGSNDNTPTKKKTTNVIDFKAVKARLGSKS